MTADGDTVAAAGAWTCARRAVVVPVRVGLAFADAVSRAVFPFTDALTVGLFLRHQMLDPLPVLRIGCPAQDVASLTRAA